MPPIQFLCSSCGHRIQVDESHAGNQAICPFCGVVVTAPAVETMATAVPTASFVNPTPPPTGSYQPPYQTGYPYRAPQPTEPFAIASFVCSLAGIVCWVSSLLGIIFGHIAMSRIKASGEQLGGRGYAKAGVIIGYIWIALMILLICLYVVFVMVIFFGVITTMDHPHHMRPGPINIIDDRQETLAIEEPLNTETNAESPQEPKVDKHDKTEKPENPFKVYEE